MLPSKTENSLPSRIHQALKGYQLRSDVKIQKKEFEARVAEAQRRNSTVFYRLLVTIEDNPIEATMVTIAVGTVLTLFVLSR